MNQKILQILKNLITNHTTSVRVNKINKYGNLRSGLALQTLLKYYKFDTILDIGSGAGDHARIFKDAGKNVTTIDYGLSKYYNKRRNNYKNIFSDYNSYSFESQFDCIWASHILEHQINPGIFLKKIHNDLKERGILSITIPPLKDQIVGGHVTLWNAGILIYQLVLAGFNCRNISIIKYDYNISIILKKETIPKLPNLHFDNGDIDRLKNYFPKQYSNEAFNGDIELLNWPGL